VPCVLDVGYVGLLVYLGIGCHYRSAEIGGKLGGAFQGTGIVGIGIVGTFCY